MSNRRLEAIKKAREARRAKKDQQFGVLENTQIDNCIEYLGLRISENPEIGKIIPTDTEQHPDNHCKDEACQLCPVWADCPWKE